MRGYIILTVLALYLQTSTASLLLKGPSGPVLEGDHVTLECVDTESVFNMSSVHFERFSKYRQTWYRLEADGLNFYSRCFLYDVDVRRENDKLLVLIPRIEYSSQGPYRCIAENTSALVNSSENFTIPIHYMREVSVHKASLGLFARYSNMLKDLNVRLGDDVELECSTSASETPTYIWAKEGEDWLIASNRLKLEKVTEQHSGKYTCTAQSPTVSSLMKKRTISITVLPVNAAWYETTNGQVALIVGGVAFVLLGIVVSMTTYLCLQANQRKSKGPIDDRSQKKPIYRASVESLPSTTSDNQPLV